MRCLTVLTTLAACVLSGGLSGCHGPSLKDQAASKAVTAQRRADDEKDSFVYMSQHFVEKRLKSLGSVKFLASSQATITKLGNNNYRVTSYFDTSNAAGTLMRSRYVCELTRISSGKWHCDDMKIEQPEPVKQP